MKMKRKSTAVLVAALVAACGLWFALRPSKQTGITLETAATSRITIRNSVTATGTVEPVTEVEVGTQVSGIIDRLYVDYNDVVKAGQLIAEMDKVTLQAELESSQAELASCKTEYEYRMKEYSRTRTLHEKELVSDPNTTKPSTSTRRRATPTNRPRPPSSRSNAIWATRRSPPRSTAWSSAAPWRRGRPWRRASGRRRSSPSPTT